MSYACLVCGKITPRKHCADHQPRDTRPPAHKRGYDGAWRKTRAAYLKAHPNCSEPGCDAPAQDVHHLDGLGPLALRGHDPENLEGLCHSHHSERTAREQPAGWHRRTVPMGIPGE
jgi:hypothetical protein